jgi:hypothetical protein
MLLKLGDEFVELLALLAGLFTVYELIAGAAVAGIGLYVVGYVDVEV